MAKRSSLEITKYVKRLSEAGVMKRPTWLEALERTPPPTEHLEAQGKRPPKIVFEEDEFIEEYYRRHPAATLEPIDLGSFYPPVAKQFAYRAVQLMEEHGMSRAEAKEQAYKDVSSQEQSLSVGERLIAKIQEEEGVHLKEAMETFRKNHENDLQSLIDA